MSIEISAIMAELGNSCPLGIYSHYLISPLDRLISGTRVAFLCIKYSSVSTCQRKETNKTELLTPGFLMIKGILPLHVSGRF